MTFDDLARERYISLTTFRRDGRAVATPVQFVIDGERLLVYTKSNTGKVKRLRHTPRATIAACDMRGRTKEGQPVDVAVAFVDPSQFAHAASLMNQRYGLPQRIFGLIRRAIERLLGRAAEPVWLELRLSQS
jgi:PPOX class probable F420-dependent enzyme